VERARVHWIKPSSGVRLGRTVWSFHWGSAILALGVAASGHALEAVTANAIVTGTGTAFLVAPDLLVTNRHVIQSCAAVDVYTSEGKEACPKARSKKFRRERASI